MITIIDKINTIVTNIQDINGEPYFYIGNKKRLNKKLTAQNLVNTFGLKKFPLVFLLLDIVETREPNAEYFTEADIDIFIIGRSLLNEDDFYRHANTMPSLRSIYQDFNNFFIRYFYDYEFDYIERFLPEMDKTSEIIDAIELHFRNAKLTKCSN